MQVSFRFYLVCFACLTGFTSTAARSHTDYQSGRSAETTTTQCSTTEQPALNCSNTASVRFDKNGRLWLVYVVGEHLWLTHSDDQGQHFKAATKVNAIPESISARGENRPQIIIHDQKVLLSWARPGRQRFTADIRFSRSSDGGLHFSPPSNLNRDTQGLEPELGHSFNQMTLDQHGRLSVFWLDGRERAQAQAQGEAFKGSSLYVTYSDDFGVTFSPEQNLSNQTCECCRLAAAVDRQDRTWLLWRQIDSHSGARDHVLAAVDRERDERGLLFKQSFSQENWQIDACPHHGPDLDIQNHSDSETEQLHAVWFSGANAESKLWYRNLRLDLDSTAKSAPDSFGNEQQQAGHPQIHSLGKQLVRSWQEYDGSEHLILTQYSMDAGKTWTAPETQMRSAGTADYAFLLNDGKRIYLSWLTQAEGYRIQALPFTKQIAEQTKL